MNDIGWINIVEQDLRALIESVLGQSLGTNWLALSGLTQERLTKLEEKQVEDAKKRPGTIVDQSLIRYSDFYDLQTIIHKNWNNFLPILGSRATFDVYFDKIASFRNPPAHSRNLLPFEMDLLAGMVGEIRNRITIHRSSMGPNQEYYPRIESIRDSLGNEAGPDDDSISISRPPVLVVGQEIEFLCTGWDPNGRALNWTLEWQTVGRPMFDSATGDQVTLRMMIDKAHVMDSLNVAIVLKGSGEFHRHRLWDDSKAFFYRVIPPTN